MNSRTNRPFRAMFSSLPAHIQRQAREAYRLFRQNPFHPGLHFKQIHPDQPIYSARVGISYRAVGVRDGEQSCGIGLGRMPTTIISSLSCEA